MVMRHAPPGRRLNSWIVLVNPAGPHQQASCAGSAKAANTAAGANGKNRSLTTVQSGAGAGRLFSVPDILLPLFRECQQQRVETLEALLPAAAVAVAGFRRGEAGLLEFHFCATPGASAKRTVMMVSGPGSPSQRCV